MKWTSYTVEDPPTSSQGKPQDPAVQFEGVSHITVGETLEEAANALRTKGFHSLFDVSTLLIWIFEIPGDSDHEAQRQSELAQVIALYGLIGKPFVFAWGMGA